MEGPRAHPRDMRESHVARALAESKDPDLLRELVALSRRTFGFYTHHYPFTLNYVWAVSNVTGLPKGSTFLDFGTGVSPVPLWLAENGYRIDCVDNSDIMRTFPVRDDWNEWGYFDYGQLHPNLRSFHAPIEVFRPRDHYDAIYSISVIAHFPTPVREATLRNCRHWLKAGGLLLLVVDLIPGTDTLWNRGGSNETPEQHGTYQMVEDQLRSLGFVICESRVERDVYKSPTDILFLIARAGPGESALADVDSGATEC